MMCNDFLERASLPSGTKTMIISSNNRLSFKKKNAMNKTEKRPMLKLPNPLIREFKNSGITLKFSFDNRLDSFRDFSKLKLLKFETLR